MSALIPRERIEQTILVIRGHRVMLDADLAALYEVETKAFNRAVTRNIERFPDDFMFRLTKKEYEDLRCHFGTSRWGGRRYLPYVFTEQGVAMLSSVLRSKRAIQVNIAIMRAFVQLREMIASNKGLARRLNELEKKYDGQFRVVFEAIRELMTEPESKPRRSDSRLEERKSTRIRLTKQGKVGAVAKCDHLTMLKYSPARPGAFTEHGRSTGQRGLVEEFWKDLNMTAKRTVPIESVIVVVREHRGILSADLARIYGVETRVLNQAVKRNLEKFPGDFIFRLTREEAETLSRSRSQSVILKRG